MSQEEKVVCLDTPEDDLLIPQVAESCTTVESEVEKSFFLAQQISDLIEDHEGPKYTTEEIEEILRRSGVLDTLYISKVASLDLEERKGVLTRLAEEVIEKNKDSPDFDVVYGAIVILILIMLDE